MNSLERIMCTVTGDNADYQPFTLMLSLYGSKLINAKATEYYQNAELWMQGQEAVIEAFNPDILITPFALAKEAEAFGSELKYLENFAPNIKKPIITELSQIKQLHLPNLRNSASMRFLFQTTELFAKKYKGIKAIASPINAPTDIPSLLMGFEMWIDTLLFHPDKVDRIMEITVSHFVAYGNASLEAGATFLVVPLNFTNPMIITEKIFKNLYPYLEKTFSQIKGPIVLHHGGCKIMPFLDRYVKLPNIIAVVLDPGESFETARQIAGDQIVLMGNIDGPGIANLSQEKPAEKTLNIFNNSKNDKHFIFASSNADISYDTPVETIKTVVDTIRNFNKY